MLLKQKCVNQWHDRDELLFLYCQQVTQATNQIVMNCADIDIITASFAPQGGEGKRPHFASLSTSFLLYDCHYGFRVTPDFKFPVLVKEMTHLLCFLF